MAGIRRAEGDGQANARYSLGTSLPECLESIRRCLDASCKTAAKTKIERRDVCWLISGGRGSKRRGTCVPVRPTGFAMASATIVIDTNAFTMYRAYLHWVSYNGRNADQSPETCLNHLIIMRCLRCILGLASLHILHDNRSRYGHEICAEGRILIQLHATQCMYQLDRYVDHNSMYRSALLHLQKQVQECTQLPGGY